MVAARHSGPNLVRRLSKRGRGVVAAKNYRPGQLIEVAPALVFPRRELRSAKKLSFYVYEWSPSTYAVVFGQGSLYNHSFEPNARYFIDAKNTVMRYYARKQIRKGEEITTNYLFHPTAKGDVGFKVK